MKKQKRQEQRKHKKKQHKKNKATKNLKSFFSLHQLPLGVLFLISTFLYLYTVSFDYALDDLLAINGNQYTTQGFGGIGKLLSTESMEGFFGQKKELLAGGRYRPLSFVTFAMEYGFFGPAPSISHFINLILYGLTGILLYRILWQIVPPKEPKAWYLTIPFIATALFIAHPLHTEVVANIKGRDEILTLLGALGALYATLKYLQSKASKWLIVSGISFFLGLLAKENAITFVGIIPLTVYFFTNYKISENIKSISPILGATILFLIIRYKVVGGFSGSDTIVKELLNNPFLQASTGEKFATIFYTMGLYLQLLFFPFTLTHDYYPKQIPIIGWGDFRAIISLLIYIALGIIAIVGIRKKSVVAYGILFYLLSFSIVSNLFFPVGTFMNERFMYIPSIGFALIIAYFLVNKLPNYIKQIPSSQLIKVTTVVILVLYGVRTLARIPAWENNYTLFRTDVKNSPNSTKVNTSAGGATLEKAATIKNDAEKDALIKEAMVFLKKALEIYPNNNDAFILTGNAHYDLNKNYPKVFEYYHKALQNNPNNARIHNTLDLMIELEKDKNNINQLVAFYEQKVLPLQPNTALAYDAIGELYGKKLNNMDKAIEYFNKALLYPDVETGTMINLATAYGFKGEFQKAIEINQRILLKEPNHAKALMNIGVSYQNLGQEAKAKEYFTKAQRINPNIGK